MTISALPEHDPIGHEELVVMENARESAAQTRTPFIMWREDFTVGHPELDDHHRTIISLLNDLYTATREGSSEEVVGGVVERLYHYTQYHFAREEDLMEKGDYPELAKHRMIHRWMTRKAEDLRKHHFQHGTEYTDKVFSFLKNWWTNHIQQLDRHYAPYVSAETT
jgi:hemerythrin